MALAIVSTCHFSMTSGDLVCAYWRPRRTAPIPETIAESQNLAFIVSRSTISNLALGFLMAGVTVGLLFALKMQGALLIGAVSGFLNLIPFLGFLCHRPGCDLSRYRAIELSHSPPRRLSDEYRASRRDGRNPFRRVAVGLHGCASGDSFDGSCEAYR